MIALAPGLDYVAAAYGCMSLGACLVPCYPPFGRKARHRMASIVKDAELTVVAVDAALESAVTQILDDCAEGAVSVIGFDPSGTPFCTEVPASSGRDDSPLIDPASDAVIQYTSGSTGDPKGVRLSHTNLVANCHALEFNMGHDENRRGLTWLPPYHDMGLMGTIFASTYGHWHLTMMSPFDFIQNPQRWAKCVQQLQITTAVAPNFALDSSVDAADNDSSSYDLSSIRELYCGAEPISLRTIRRFNRAFAAKGFNPAALIPCYGMAEATLLVAAKRRGTSYRVDNTAEGGEVMCVGVIAAGHEVVIAIGEQQQPPRHVGEILVRGPSVAKGYLGRADLSRKVFEGCVIGLPGKTFLRTGDLGYLDEHGELYVTGRIKDVIIIDGENLYPSDLESTAESVDEVIRAVAVRTHADAGFEMLCEIKEDLDLADTVSSIVAEIVRTHGKRPHRVLLAHKGAITLTTSGKVRRSETRRRIQDGEIIVLNTGPVSVTGVLG